MMLFKKNLLVITLAAFATILLSPAVDARLNDQNKNRVLCTPSDPGEVVPGAGAGRACPPGQTEGTLPRGQDISECTFEDNPCGDEAECTKVKGGFDIYVCECLDGCPSREAECNEDDYSVSAPFDLNRGRKFWECKKDGK
ncbi:MAG: hypothetical protein SGARI_003453 [Bacillariaceae sp.]